MTTTSTTMPRRDADARAERLRSMEFAAEQERERRLGRSLDGMPEAEREQLAIAVLRRYPAASRWWKSSAWRKPHNILRDLLLREIEHDQGGLRR